MKPMLAYTVDNPRGLQFPLLASPKLDGIRCVCTVNDGPVSRSLKPIPNRFIHGQLFFYPPFDGELMVGDPTDPSAFNRSTSGIMSHDGEPDFTYWVFDFWKLEQLYFEERLRKAEEQIKAEACWRARLVPHKLIEHPDDLLAYEAEQVGLGYEGIMVRDPRGHYKHGRSTAREGLLGKVKRFEDTEGTIVGFEELMHNDNEQTTNNLGYAERSNVSANMRPGNTLGALRVKHPAYEEDFGIGTGFDAAQRDYLWANRDTLLGTLVKFKHQPSGAKDKPRFPVYLGIRRD